LRLIVQRPRAVLARRAGVCDDCNGEPAGCNVAIVRSIHRSTGGIMSALKPKIVLSRLDGTDWTRKGLRSFLEYRDLGLAEATEGRVGGTIGRAIKKFEPGGGAPRHTHNTSFHLIFVMRGWFRTEFEGLGEVVVRQGDCIAYQGEIPQAHIEYSDDFEVMQIASPADYSTENITS
jgi:hypothetical protein